MSGLYRAVVTAFTLGFMGCMSIEPGASRQRAPGAGPRKRRAMREVFPLLVASLLLVDCGAPRPELVVQPGTSLSGRTLLAVAPAVNDTGQTYELDIAGVFTDDLASALRSKGYTVTDSSTAPADAVIVQCSFVSYAPGNAFQRWVAPGWGPTEATVKTSLIDKNTGALVGGMLTRKEVTSGGLFTLGAYEFILQRVADEVADAIDRKIKGI